MARNLGICPSRAAANTNLHKQKKHGIRSLKPSEIRDGCHPPTLSPINDFALFLTGLSLPELILGLYLKISLDHFKFEKLVSVNRRSEKDSSLVAVIQRMDKSLSSGLLYVS